MKTLALAAIAALLGACTIPAAEAPGELAAAWCKKKRKCDRGDFDAQWDNRRECEEDVEEIVDGLGDFYDLLGCEYDGREAARARSDIRGASCEEFVRGDFSDPEIYDCR